MNSWDEIRESLRLANPAGEKLSRARQASPPLPPSATPSREQPLSHDIEITDEYRRVLSLVESGVPVLFITGKAGTGKTTLIDVIRSLVQRETVVAAPTGVAAVNIRGVTLHSLFGLPPKILQEEDIRRIPNRRILGKLELLIIDEISMVRADILDAVDIALRRVRRDPRPFGGVQLVLVGDLFQLPPVLIDDEKSVFRHLGYPSEFFFSAQCLQKQPLVSLELSRIFRQEEKPFTDLLNRIREGRRIPETVETLNRKTFDGNSKPPGAITLTCTNAVARRINQRELEQIRRPLRTFEGHVDGEEGFRLHSLPAPYRLQLKEGAQVMFTRNDPEKRWVNGSLGTVHHMAGDSIHVRLLAGEEGDIFEVQRASWKKYQYTLDTASGKIGAEIRSEYIQYPLVPAWAVTIHKSQGKTIDRIFIDLGRGAFAPGQLYVALSRARRLSDIRLARRIRPSDVLCDPGIMEFHRELRKEEREPSSSKDR